MVRASSSLALVARWLADEVGEGTIFTKHALRAALPQFEQVDRRMRDLRSHGWRIDTNLEDAQLQPGELRLVVVGLRPGEVGFKSLSTSRVSSKERVAAFSAAEFRCSQCGVQLGEADESDAGFAQLRAIRIEDGLIVVCALCSTTGARQARDAAAVLDSRLSKLSAEEVREFRARVAAGRGTTAVESAVAIAARVSSEIALKRADAVLSAMTG